MRKSRKPLTHLIQASFLILAAQFGFAQDFYYPPPGEWERRAPEQVGMDRAKLDAAVQLAKDNTDVEPRDMAQFIERSFGDEPHFSILGPVKRREEGSGLVVRNGYIVAEWGDIEREDMTFSVAKSYLSTMAGLALDAGLIEDVTDPVKDYFPHESFDDPHNAPITWEHFLNQSSDWAGTLWGKPDWADRPHDNDPAKAINREMHEPGTFYKYNDVRVNMLAYSLLNVWREPLDGVLKERVMDPIGASEEWEWHGYENSWWRLTAGACNRHPAAPTGAADFSSAPSTTPASDTFSCATATGTAGSSFPPIGWTRCASLRRPSSATATCGG